MECRLPLGGQEGCALFWEWFRFAYRYEDDWAWEKCFVSALARLSAIERSKFGLVVL